jgi:hypothetical protein
MEQRSAEAAGGEAESRPPPLVVGWREHIDFPEWHLRGIVAKLDTGARTGAIDVSELEELPGDRVRFAIRLKRRSGEASRHLEAPILRRARVRSAFGHAHDRLFIEATIRIGKLERRVELGLVSRKKMLCRVLLGRKALEGQFVVDSGRRYLLGRRRRSGGRCRETSERPRKDTP